MGSLRPCGCSGGQLGGLEKRPAVFNTVAASRRITIDTGVLAADDREQDLIKFRIMLESLGLLRYDMVCLTDQDQAIAGQVGLLTGPQRTFAVLRDGVNGSGVFTKRFQDLGITVRAASFDPRLGSTELVAKLFPGANEVSTIDILILRQSDSDLLRDIIDKCRGIDCVICPPDADEPHLLSAPGVKPLIVTVGRFGRHIGRLRVAVPAAQGEFSLQFDAIPVTADLPDDPVLARLYGQYQQLVSEANLLENYPRVPLPDDLAFTGSEDCRRCHEYEYDEWSMKAHADALNVLKKVGSDRDPECVICHVVGMEYEGGYTTEETTRHLKDVGCEACHGPGSEHAQTDGVKLTRPPQRNCLDCHTPEKSTGYAGHEDEYLQKIIHWREPAAAGNVKD
ncbi:MAG: cytochrome c family protein [Phycisphaerales bacterium]